MKAELYTDETPGTVANFVKLAESRFYDGLTFHRVIPGFVIQGGCPKGDGTGGPGYTIKCETSAPRQYHDRGVLSMAHAGRDTGGSQFFICHTRETTQHLDGRHTCFGRVVEGLDVIDDIRPGDLILSIRIVEEIIPEAAEVAKGSPCGEPFFVAGRSVARKRRPHGGLSSSFPHRRHQRGAARRKGAAGLMREPAMRCRRVISSGSFRTAFPAARCFSLAGIRLSSRTKRRYL